MNKASGGDGIPAEIFKILKDDVVSALASLVGQLVKILPAVRETWV